MKKIKYPQGRKLKLKISSFEGGLAEKDENVLPFKFAHEMYNYNISGGNLKKSIGFADFLSHFCEKSYFDRFSEMFESLGKILGVWHFKKYNSKASAREDKLIFINDKLQTFYIDFNQNNKSFNRVYSLAFSSLPVAVNYRLNGEDVIIFSSPTDNMVVWDGENTAYSVLDAPKITSMALHYERLFATVNGEKNAVWFSDDLDPTNWSVSLDEAGFIQMIDERGSLEKVVSFNDYLYIFREQGISRVTAYASQENFSVSHLFVSSSLIYKNTVCICGNRILFLAADGLYKFDGYDTVKILPALESRFSHGGGSAACACYYNGKYYLSCRFKFETEEEMDKDTAGNNCLLEIDIDKMTFNIIRGVSISFLSGIVSDNFKGVLAVIDSDKTQTLTLLDDSGSFFDEPLVKRWRSPFSDLGYPSSSKVVRQIALTTNYPLEVDIVSDKSRERVKLNGSESPQVFEVFVPGEKFRFDFLSKEADANVSNVEILIKVES